MIIHWAIHLVIETVTLINSMFPSLPEDFRRIVQEATTALHSLLLTAPYMDVFPLALISFALSATPAVLMWVLTVRGIRAGITLVRSRGVSQGE